MHFPTDWKRLVPLRAAVSDESDASWNDPTTAAFGSILQTNEYDDNDDDENNNFDNDDAIDDSIDEQDEQHETLSDVDDLSDDGESWSSAAETFEANSGHINANNARNWLERMTESYLTVGEDDSENHQVGLGPPLGALSEEDLGAITTLMTSWAKKGLQSQSAIMVERLLKRIIDDMNAGNEAVHVNTHLYTIVSDSTVIDRHTYG